MPDSTEGEVKIRETNEEIICKFRFEMNQERIKNLDKHIKTIEEFLAVAVESKFKAVFERLNDLAQHEQTIGELSKRIEKMKESRCSVCGAIYCEKCTT